MTYLRWLGVWPVNVRCVTRFSLRFPLLKTEMAPFLASAAKQGMRGAGEHILVVDDEVQQCDIASKIFKVYGYKVDAVASGGLLAP